MLKQGNSYETVQNAFRWEIPVKYNIGVDACDKFAAQTPNAPALIDLDPSGNPKPISFLKLKQHSNKLANALLGRGLKVGDRVVSNGPHAELVAVPHHLCALIPEGVEDETASNGFSATSFTLTLPVTGIPKISSAVS